MDLTYQRGILTCPLIHSSSPSHSLLHSDDHPIVQYSRLEYVVMHGLLHYAAHLDVYRYKISDNS